jgi:hypothetical protein
MGHLDPDQARVWGPAPAAHSSCFVSSFKFLVHLSTSKQLWCILQLYTLSRYNSGDYRFDEMNMRPRCRRGDHILSRIMDADNVRLGGSR